MTKRKKKRSSFEKFLYTNKNAKVYLVFVVVFIIVFIISFVLLKNRSNNYNDIKIIKDKFIVYTQKESKKDDYSIKIPYLNIDGEIAKSINKDILLFTGEFSNKCNISYEYDINGIILSLVVKIVDFDTEYAPNVYFRTYNFNLDSLELISDDGLLNFFEVTEDIVNEKIEEKFKYFYQDEVKEGFFAEGECNYECFLKNRGFNNYLDDVQYFVKKGKLIVFKPFVYASVYSEEEYFEDSDFEISIASKE